MTESAATVFNGVSIDTRTLVTGELYIALRGINHDGHSFLSQAQDKGAVGALIEKSGVTLLPKEFPAVAVEDSHQALIDLAIAHRKQMTKNTAGVTGSVGKTTVKEMTRHLIEQAGATVQVSAGNLNNLYGLPLSLLQMDIGAEYGIFELGISTPDEMKRLAPILQPRVGVITNVSETHVEALGSIEGVRREKLNLLENLQDGGSAVVNGADTELARAARDICDTVLTFGVIDDSQSTNRDMDVSASDVALDSATGHVSFMFEGQKVRLPVFGEEQVANALCAFAVCRALGVNAEMGSLESFTSQGLALRGERQKIAGVEVILDCYNANPTSMKAGLRTFVAMKQQESAAKKIAVIGDMLELGAIETQEHVVLGEYLASLLNTAGVIDVIITVGQRTLLSAKALEDSTVATKSEIHSVSDAQEASALLATLAREGDTVYLKASRGVALENALLGLKEIASKARSQK